MPADSLTFVNQRGDRDPVEKSYSRPRCMRARRALDLAAARNRLESEGWRVRKDGSRFWAPAIAIRAVFGDVAMKDLRNFAPPTLSLLDLANLRRNQPP
jgi:hypothetical protein